MKKTSYRIILLAGMWLLAACSSSTPVSGVSAEAGEALFRKAVLGGAAGCATCHSIEAGAVLIGPSLAGIGSQADKRVEGISAEAYLKQSIVEPEAYLAAGFPGKVMPGTFGKNLNADEIDSLVAYLLSQK